MPKCFSKCYSVTQEVTWCVRILLAALELARLDVPHREAKWVVSDFFGWLVALLSTKPNELGSVGWHLSPNAVCVTWCSYFWLVDYVHFITYKRDEDKEKKIGLGIGSHHCNHIITSWTDVTCKMVCILKLCCFRKILLLSIWVSFLFLGHISFPSSYNFFKNI